MARRTKILATLGPASEDADTIRSMVDAGLDAARLNFSHGEPEDHRQLARRVRRAADEVARPVSLVQDLQGTKIRLREVAEGARLQEGQTVDVLASQALTTSDRLTVDDVRLVEALEDGSQLLLGDGDLELVVRDADADPPRAEVLAGGGLRDRMGITARGVELPGGLTEKDQNDLLVGRDIGVDYVATSFVGSAADVANVREFLAAKGDKTPVLAKIERRQALDNIHEIADVADGMMVARGDLGLALEPQQVPVAQKRILRACQQAGVISITATQMLESMVENPRPTRAETSDVANAILDGSQVVMLSGETAIGADPTRAVATMADIAEATETAIGDGELEDEAFEGAQPGGSRDDAIANAAVVLANDLDADAIVTMTTSGSTALRVAKFRPWAPLIAATPDEDTYAKLSLVWGVRPFLVPEATTLDDMVWVAEDAAKAVGDVEPGDTIVVTAGQIGVPGTTNLLRVAQVR
ncbi:pyruvate kinase [Thermoplasmatales archaeon SW_10_69_26]|nr:MAG: pyruvate kinase [Thermoplasmatales archaeon SW_10_69_26]